MCSEYLFLGTKLILRIPRESLQELVQIHVCLVQREETVQDEVIDSASAMGTSGVTKVTLHGMR